jgi:hypothetical protein
MFVFVDANIIVGDPQLRHPVWAQLREAVGLGHVHVVASEIVFDEAVSTYRRSLKTIRRELLEKVQFAPSGVKAFVEQARDECNIIAERYEAALPALWAEHGFEMVKVASTSHGEVARRATTRTRPFNDQGGGYRDTIHWLTLLKLAAEHPREAFVILTNDRIFASGAFLQRSLVQEFEGINQAGIILKRKLQDLEVPGHYETAPEIVHGYESSLLARLKELLGEEYALHKIRTSGLSVPSSDWEELLRASRLELSYVTQRRIQRQELPELQFHASAVFTIRSNYIIDDDPQTMEIGTQDVDMQVEMTGIASILSRSEVGTLRDVEAVHVGQDLIYADFSNEQIPRRSGP